MSEVLDCLAVIGIVVLIGAGIFGAGVLVYRVQTAMTESSTEFEQQLKIANVTWQSAYGNLTELFTIYNDSYIEQEPYIETTNLTEFINLCQEWNRTSLLSEPFEHRYTGFLSAVSIYSGAFWFSFNDNGIEVQARFKVEVP